MPGRLILASTSPYRRRLLARLGLPFAIEPPLVDERLLDDEPPARRAARLADAKAQAVCERHPDDWVLGSDQVAECEGAILDKPGDAAGCRAQLRRARGRSVRFHTAVALRRLQPAASDAHLDLTVVRFRELEEREIARYVALDEPFDCAGGFRCERLGIVLFESVAARDPTALEGLPLIWVATALRRAGLDALAAGLSPAQR